jgi:hypothetical protein
MCFRLLVPIALVLLGLSGCRDAEVHAYRVPKEALPAPPPAAAANPHAHAHTHLPGAGTLAWEAPAHWQEKPASGFRRGSFAVMGPAGVEADFSIIAFPGAAGGMAENFNRWRGQLALPSQSPTEISAGVEHLDAPSGLHFDLVDYVGTTGNEPTRIIGAVVEFGGESWFFKLMGPDALVAGEKQAFRDFLFTVRPSTP